MKVSNATSAKATASPQRTGPSSASRPPSRTSADGFSLSGPSNAPDDAVHAYRKDLADVALAGRVIASHYAEPLRRPVVTAAPLYASSDGREVIGELLPGDSFELLDNSLGWAWGYAGADRRVGYVRSEALGL